MTQDDSSLPWPMPARHSTPSSSLPGSCAKVRSLSQTSANSSLPCPLSLAFWIAWLCMASHMALIWKANGIRCVSNPKPEAQARIAHLAIHTRYLQAISIGHPASMALLPQNPRCWRCQRQWFSHQYSMTWSTADMVYHPPVCVEIVFFQKEPTVLFFSWSTVTEYLLPFLETRPNSSERLQCTILALSISSPDHPVNCRTIRKHCEKKAA